MLMQVCELIEYTKQYDRYSFVKVIKNNEELDFYFTKDKGNLIIKIQEEE